MEVYIQEVSLQFMMHLASQREEILTLAIYSTAVGISVSGSGWACIFFRTHILSCHLNL
jgi:hypothetical protein